MPSGRCTGDAGGGCGRASGSAEGDACPDGQGQRLADEAFPTHYKITKRKIEKMVRKKIAARVRLPRASASMRIKFKLDLAPQLGIKAMCEEAGLVMKEGPMRCGSTMKRVWKADGPAATARFAQLNKEHPLGWGGAKLGAAPKGAKRKVSRVMTLLAPPLEVDHRTGLHCSNCEMRPL